MTVYDALDRADRRRHEHLIRSLVQRGVVTEVDASKKMQILNVEVRRGHAPQKVEHWESYGRTHHPAPGSEVLLVAVNGDPDHLVAIDVADRRHRPKDLAAGEQAIHDDQGQSVTLKRDSIVIKSGMKIRIEGPVEIEGDITHTGNLSSTGVHQAGGGHT